MSFIRSVDRLDSIRFLRPGSRPEPKPCPSSFSPSDEVRQAIGLLFPLEIEQKTTATSPHSDSDSEPTHLFGAFFRLKKKKAEKRSYAFLHAVQLDFQLYSKRIEAALLCLMEWLAELRRDLRSARPDTIEYGIHSVLSLLTSITSRSSPGWMKELIADCLVHLYDFEPALAVSLFLKDTNLQVLYYFLLRKSLWTEHESTLQLWACAMSRLKKQVGSSKMRAGRWLDCLVLGLTWGCLSFSLSAELFRETMALLRRCLAESKSEEVAWPHLEPLLLGLDCLLLLMRRFLLIVKRAELESLFALFVAERLLKRPALQGSLLLAKIGELLYYHSLLLAMSDSVSSHKTARDVELQVTEKTSQVSLALLLLYSSSRASRPASILLSSNVRHIRSAYFAYLGWEWSLSHWSFLLKQKDLDWLVILDAHIQRRARAVSHEHSGQEPFGASSLHCDVGFELLLAVLKSVCETGQPLCALHALLQMADEEPQVATEPVAECSSTASVRAFCGWRACLEKELEYLFATLLHASKSSVTLGDQELVKACLGAWARMVQQCAVNQPSRMKRLYSSSLVVYYDLWMRLTDAERANKDFYFEVFLVLLSSNRCELIEHALIAEVVSTLMACFRSLFCDGRKTSAPDWLSLSNGFRLLHALAQSPSLFSSNLLWVYALRTLSLVHDHAREEFCALTSLLEAVRSRVLAFSPLELRKLEVLVECVELKLDRTKAGSLLDNLTKWPEVPLTAARAHGAVSLSSAAINEAMQLRSLLCGPDYHDLQVAYHRLLLASLPKMSIREDWQVSLLLSLLRPAASRWSKEERQLLVQLFKQASSMHASNVALLDSCLKREDHEMLLMLSESISMSACEEDLRGSSRLLAQLLSSKERAAVIPIELRFRLLLEYDRLANDPFFLSPPASDSELMRVGLLEFYKLSHARWKRSDQMEAMQQKALSWLKMDTGCLALVMELWTRALSSLAGTETWAACIRTARALLGYGLLVLDSESDRQQAWTAPEAVPEHWIASILTEMGAKVKQRLTSTSLLLSSLDLLAKLLAVCPADVAAEPQWRKLISARFESWLSLSLSHCRSPSMPFAFQCAEFVYERRLIFLYGQITGLDTRAAEETSGAEWNQIGSRLLELLQSASFLSSQFRLQLLDLVLLRAACQSVRLEHLLHLILIVEAAPLPISTYGRLVELAKRWSLQIEPSDPALLLRVLWLLCHKKAFSYNPHEQTLMELDEQEHDDDHEQKQSQASVIRVKQGLTALHSITLVSRLLAHLVRARQFSSKHLPTLVSVLAILSRVSKLARESLGYMDALLEIHGEMREEDGTRLLSLYSSSIAAGLNAIAAAAEEEAWSWLDQAHYYYVLVNAYFVLRLKAKLLHQFLEWTRARPAQVSASAEQAFDERCKQLTVWTALYHVAMKRKGERSFHSFLMDNRDMYHEMIEAAMQSPIVQAPGSICMAVAVAASPLPSP